MSEQPLVIPTTAFTPTSPHFLLTVEWKVTDNSRRAPYNSLTRDCRRALRDELAQWHRIAAAVKGDGVRRVTALRFLHS